MIMKMDELFFCRLHRIVFFIFSLRSLALITKSSDGRKTFNTFGLNEKQLIPIKGSSCVMKKLRTINLLLFSHKRRTEEEGGKEGKTSANNSAYIFEYYMHQALL